MKGLKMACLFYNGVPIYIKQDNTGACRVCITEIYKAAGRPPNKSPTNFKNSKQGKEQIKHFERYQGTWVWQSRTGKNTHAIVQLGFQYLVYLGDMNAANALRQAYETGKDQVYNADQVAYNTNPMNDYQYYIEQFISTQFGQVVVIILIVVSFLWIYNLLKSPEPPPQLPENQIQCLP
ncbi:MAG: hypothetical protein ACRCU2_06310 [Planktothrix sp.]